MSSRIHPQARTTPKIRQEIKDSGLSDREAAKVFNISRATAAKWLKRYDVQDRSHRAHTLYTTLSTTQEAIVLSLRQLLYLLLDDLLYITRQYINPDVSRSGIAVCSNAKAWPAWKMSLPRLREKRSRPRRPSRTTNPALFTSTSNTCRRCQTKPRAAICSWPSTAPRVGCSCISTVT